MDYESYMSHQTVNVLHDNVTKIRVSFIKVPNLVICSYAHCSGSQLQRDAFRDKKKKR